MPMSMPLLLLAYLLVGAAAQVTHTKIPPGMRSCRNPATVFDASATLVTYVGLAGSVHPGYSNFMRSAHSNGWRVVNVGMRDTAWNGGESNKNWAARMIAYLDYARQQPPNNLLVISDAFDVLITSSPHELAARFEAIDRRIVFAAERFCDTDACRKQKGSKEALDILSPADNPYRYLNAGVMVGRARHLALLFQAASLNMLVNDIDDQAALMKLMTQLGNRHDITLDYDSALFGVVSAAKEHVESDWVSFRKGGGALGLRRKKSGQEPVFLHFAGMRYESNPAQRFNPCQRVLIELYNKIAESWSLQTSRPPRVVVSLTTTPPRVPGLKPTLDSLFKQTHPPAVIYLNLPHFSKRFNQSYEVPAYLTRYANYPPHNNTKFIINRCDDFGPATKIIPTLQAESSPDTLVMTVDDEYEYPPNMVEHLVEHQLQTPHAAFGYAGQLVEEDEEAPGGLAVRSVDRDVYHRQPAAVDILEAFLGAVYRRSFFNLDEFQKVPKACWTTDDIWIATHLASQNIPRVKIPMTFERPKETENDQKAPLRQNNVHGPGKNVICAKAHLDVLKAGWLSRPIPCPVRYEKLVGLDTPEVGGRAKWWKPTDVTAPCNLTPP